MSDYIIFGKKGDGKSLVSVGRMRGILLAGNPVATNLDLRLEFLLPPGLRNVRCYRLPDRPTIDDLKMIGRGSDSKSESKFGGVFLDECATMLNSRNFNDKGRASMLDWFVHSRKLGWVTHFICQNPIQIDKQVRESLADLMVCCRRLDKVRIPFLGVITKNLLGFELRPPAIHVATVRYGSGNDAMVSDRWTYTGTKELYASYDTNQIFQDNYPHGIYSLLSPWHLSCRAAPPASDFVGPIRGPIDYVILSQRVSEKKWNKHMTKYFAMFFAVGLLFGVGGMKYWGPAARVNPAVSVASAPGVVVPVEARKYSETLSGRGLFKREGVVTVLLSDGSMVTSPKSFTSSPSGWEAEISEGVWVKGAAQ